MFIISNEPGNGGINIDTIERFICTSVNTIAFFYHILDRKSHYTGNDVPSFYWKYPDQKSMLSDYAKIVNEIKLYQQTHSILAQQILLEGDNDQNTGG